MVSHKKLNHVIVRLKNNWMGKKFLNLPGLSYEFFSHKNLRCCLIGLLHIYVI